MRYALIPLALLLIGCGPGALEPVPIEVEPAAAWWVPYPPECWRIIYEADPKTGRLTPVSYVWICEPARGPE